MKTFAIVFSFIFLLIETGICDETYGYKLGARFTHGNYRWNIGVDQLSSTPEWIETKPIPFPLEKACQLGKDWLNKHGFTKYGLDEVRLISYPDVRALAYSHNENKARQRFFYELMYRSEDIQNVGDNTMYVYVLMDGTVVEPNAIIIKTH